METEITTNGQENNGIACDKEVLYTKRDAYLYRKAAIVSAFYSGKESIMRV
jgi:hypothetical protein